MRHGREKIVLVRPALAAGAQTSAHPLWHSLVAQRPSLEEEICVRAEAVLFDRDPTLAGRNLVRAPVALVPPPEPTSEWTAPAKAISARSLESATSLASLLACPLQWTLGYAGKLYPGVRQSLPNMDTLVGTLAHRIAQEIFHPGDPPAPEVAEAEAATLVDELLPRIAATLLLPGAAGELAAARSTVPQALAELARFLSSEKLSVVGVEYGFSVPDTLAAGAGVNGRIDLLAKTAEGRLVVIDLKWQRSESWRRAELKNGVALQLSVYARHVSDENVDAATGYFMLRQRRFLTATPLRGEGPTTVIDGPTPKDTWDRVLASRTSAMADIEAGTVRALFDQSDTKLEDFTDRYLLVPPKCGYCDYAGLCEVNS
ncbi:MAG: RecB family exonuclease [Methylocystis sp.]